MTSIPAVIPRCPVFQEFGCAVVNVDSYTYNYDYNLALANAAADKRVRFHWVPDTDQHDWHIPKRCFDLVLACHLSSHVTNYERALKNLQVRI